MIYLLIEGLCPVIRQQRHLCPRQRFALHPLRRPWSQLYLNTGWALSLALQDFLKRQDFEMTKRRVCKDLLVCL
jgi:hypothetical protein